MYSKPIKDVLMKGDKKLLMSVYSDVILETAAFYLPMMPTNTGKAKASFESIGRTLVETYPVLAVTEGSNSSWAVLNGKISQAIRNARCRIKRKLSVAASNSSPSTSKPKKYASSSIDVTVVKEKLEEEEFKEKIESLKRESLKEQPDHVHIRLLLGATYLNRREWLQNSPSSKLRLKEVLELYPCFKMPQHLQFELWQIVKKNKSDSFVG